MDPLSHAALGRTLIALAPAERCGRPMVVAATIGALSPDVDAVVMPFGWDIYLRVHEIGTHSLAGTLVCAILTAAAIRLFRRTHPLSWLVAAAWTGAISHVLLDLLSSARARVFWPIADRQVSIPLVAMADPWLAAIIVFGAVVVVARRSRPVAGWALAAAVVFLLIKAGLALRAVDAYLAASGAADVPVEARLVEARWASLSEWHIFDRAGANLRGWRADGASARVQRILTWPTAEPADLAASRSLPVVRNFLHVHDLGFAAIVERRDGPPWLLWSDLRYCWNPDAGGAPKLEPMVASGSLRLACGLWFGAELDGAGKALHQVIRIGRFTQRRAAPE